MSELPLPWVMAGLGFVGGAALGATARLARFCAFGAIESALLVGDWTRMRAWLLAIAVAVAAVQAMHLAGVARIPDAFYLAPMLNLGGAVVGGLLFGFGMALVGTCGYGTLIRLGGGDLRALVTFLVLGLTAYMTARGLTGLLRVGLLDPLSVDVSWAGSQGLPDLLGTGLPADPNAVRATVAAMTVAGLLWWALRDARFRRSRRDLAAGIVIGLVVAAGFFVTGALGDDPFQPQRVESFSYALPLGETVVYALTFTGATIDFSVGAVVGTFAGALATAVVRREIRFEAFDDAREMGRHLIGAALMGFGGVCALGCTIGQGISGMATLATSAPLALMAIVAGAWLGLHCLMEGGIGPGLRQAWASLRG